MRIRIGFDISIQCAGPTPLLLALHPHPDEDHRLMGTCEIVTDPKLATEVFLDEFGNRRARVVARPGVLRLRADCVAQDAGEPDAVVACADQHAVEDLPLSTLGFLSSSRYCEVDEMSAKAWELFGHTEPGWARVQAICDFVHHHVTFGYGYARSTKTASDTLREGRGVCRDFAHLMITLCRAMNFPARYVSGYLGDIGVPPAGPGDFCAWTEVFLGGRWHTFDARYNIPRIGRIVMVRGRDAADVPMIAAFGQYSLKAFEVWTDEVPATNRPARIGRPSLASHNRMPTPLAPLLAGEPDVKTLGSRQSQ
ncbi:transglutaminase family protein [Microbaculum marinum]|uniref:Transglutaminase family protein n=1 Tax=Microbaculum marinum TaxID=1764581 RepID=A0AAW9RQ11_9HYPH